MKLVRNRVSFEDVSRLARRATRSTGMVVCALVTGLMTPGCGQKSSGAGTGPGSGSGSAVVDDAADGDDRVDADAGASGDGDGGGGGGGDAGGGGGGNGTPDPEPDPVPTRTLDLVDTVETTTKRADMSAFLVKPAKAADDKRDWPKAIVLYQALVVARGPGSAEARRLADVWALSGQSDEAARVLQGYIASATDADTIKSAKADLLRITKNPDPFAKQFELPALKSEAEKAFKAGRAAYKKKQWGDALVQFHMGYALSPDLPGFLRELGATYEKLGAKDRKLEFYRAYLYSRPFGKNSDDIRKELAKEKVLGSLTVTSSLPCEQVMINRQVVPGKLPKKDLQLAPGTYKGLCYNTKYEIAFFEYGTVTAGSTGTLEFNWAIVVNALENPYGRISIENPRSPGVMMDLGITNPEVGVVVPADGRSLKVIVKDDAGTKTEERYVKLTPGQRQVIKW